MSAKSKIEWTDTTWNPVTGCTKVSQGCKHCYAERDWARLSAPRTPPNIYTGRAFADVQCHPERLDQPLKWTRPRRIFVNSMSDLFHEDVPFAFVDDVMSRIAFARQHVYQILTKRADRMLAYFISRHFFNCAAGEWPWEHVWIGVSVEDQDAAEERIPLLLQTPAAVRWISAEPLLSSVDLSKWLSGIPYRAGGWLGDDDQKIGWVVVGGESGPKARPMHADWARSIRSQCKAAGVPVFVKQLSGQRGRPVKDISQFPEDLRIREYPR